jgi:hypothetical protein
MQSETIYELTSKHRLQEIKMKLEKKIEKSPVSQLDEFRQSLFTSFRSSPSTLQASKDRGLRDKIGFKGLSPDLSHYSSLDYFKSSKVLLKSKEKIKDRALFTSSITNKIHSDDITQLISIATLNNATRVISKSKLNDLSRAYIRQLKQFCNEVLANTN